MVSMAESFATFRTTSRNFPHEPNKINAESVREVAGSMCDKPPIPLVGRIAPPSPLARSGRSRPALRPWGAETEPRLHAGTGT